MNLTQIKISDIVVPQERFTTHYQNPMWLCQNMKKSGFILPLVVKRDNATGKYILVDGYNRLRCLQELGIDEAPVIVTDEFNVDYINFVLNYVRGRKCGWETLSAINQLVNEGVDISAIGMAVNRSQSTIKTYLSVYRTLIKTLTPDDIEYIKAQCMSLKRLITCAYADSVRDCIYGRSRALKNEEVNRMIQVNQIMEEVRKMIQQGIPTYVILAKLYELQDEWRHAVNTNVGGKPN